MSADMLIAIALWCTNPSNHTISALHPIQECRERIMECQAKDPRNPSWPVLECFKKEKLK